MESSYDMKVQHASKYRAVFAVGKHQNVSKYTHEIQTCLISLFCFLEVVILRRPKFCNPRMSGEQTSKWFFIHGRKIPKKLW